MKQEPRKSCLVYSSKLKMEATCSSETSVDFQRTTWSYFPEDRSLHNHRREKLKSYLPALEISEEFQTQGIRAKTDRPYCIQLIWSKTKGWWFLPFHYLRPSPFLWLLSRIVLRRCQYPEHTTSDDEWMIILKDFETSNSGLIETLSRNLSWETKVGY
jgi:hypothetical protein